jgi:hypothetical protein
MTVILNELAGENEKNKSLNYLKLCKIIFRLLSMWEEWVSLSQKW